MLSRSLVSILSVAVCALSLCNARAAEDASAPGVEEILKATGFRGGLAVCVGLQDAALPLSLAKGGNTLVHGLAFDAATLNKLRGQICDAGGHGRVSAMLWKGPLLPYADGMVNLLLVLDESVEVTPEEIERVLAPGGVAARRITGDSNPLLGRRTDSDVQAASGSIVWGRKSPGNVNKGLLSPVIPVFRKPWPADVDEWTHSRHDSTGNAVSTDKRVGPPQFLQWEATPRWNRGVKTSSLVTAGGRIFFILDDSHFASAERSWSLIARDAFNGIQLWRHALSDWTGARGGKKVGPAQVHRRLVASGDRVYVTLGGSAPISVLDAATGEPLRVLAGTESTEEFVLSDGILVALVNPNTPAGIRRGVGKPMSLAAYDAVSGKALWKHTVDEILPMTLAADGKHAVYHDGKIITSLDLRTGTVRWTSVPTGQKIEVREKAHPDSPGAEAGTIILAPQFAPTMIVYKGVVAFAGGQQLSAYSGKDGRELWRTDYAATNYSVPVDLFGFADHLWGPDAGMNLWRPLDDNIDFNAYDPLTGTIEKQLSGKYGFKFQHHRCYQMKVVDNTILASRAGIEFLDTDTSDVAGHHWVRGSCYYGIMPGNGLLYLPPHNCACYIRAKLSGFMALTSQPSARTDSIPADKRLRKGPAYGQTSAELARSQAEDWPTYRHDAGRSGRASTKIGSELLLGWETPLANALTSPVVAGGSVFVASQDTHRLYALGTETGEVRWRHSFDARVDSPPTVHDGLVLCGCRDGSVQALRVSDGALVWRFQACPKERWIVSRGQVESAWPVNGSVLVLNGTVYLAAGKSSYLDGGMYLYGLDPHTGRVLVETPLSTLGADGSEVIDEQGLDGFLNSVLSSDGDHLFMRHHVFDKAGTPMAERIPHLHGPDGFLSGDTTARLVWTYAPMYTSPHQGAFYDLRLNRCLFPSGRILVEDEETIFGYGQNFYDRPHPDPGGTWALFAAAKKSDVPLNLSAMEYRKLALSGKKKIQFKWWKEIPVRVWAMVQAGDVLFVAGPRGGSTVPEEALQGETDAALLAISPSDGSVLAEMKLPAPPVWDGMAAANRNLYLTLRNGQVLCLWDMASGRPGKPLSPAAWRTALPPLKLAEEPGLWGRWRFDEGVGLLARDCSGKGRDAAVSGRWVTEGSSVCLSTDGVADAAVIPDAPHLQFGKNEFTLAFWIRVSERDARLLGKEAFPENWWVINLLQNGQAELVLGEGRGAGKSVRAKTNKAVPVDRWTHLAVVADRKAKEVRWYVNGTPDGRAAIPETMTDGVRTEGHPIRIPSAHKPFRGCISDLRIYGQAIGAERVRGLFGEEAARLAGMHKGE